MSGLIDIRRVSIFLGLLCVFWGLLQHGFVATQNTTSAIPMDNRTMNQSGFTWSGRNTTMIPGLSCYNDTSANTTCMSATGICYASYTLSTGTVSPACRSLNSTAAPVCSGISSVAVPASGRCEFCCMANLCNRVWTAALMKTACCNLPVNQVQPSCSSDASCMMVTTLFVPVMLVMSAFLSKCSQGIDRGI